MTPRVFAATLVLSVAAAGSAQAVVYGGVDFPAGAISFADTVLSYSPGIVASGPTLPHRGSDNALGVPDYAGVNSCTSAATCSFVSLGVGGSIVVRFDDNVLTGSGNADKDLWIFEVGPDVEDTTVEVSTDGLTWLGVGGVGGSTAGVDLDAFGYGIAAAFRYVRLTDVAALDGTSGGTVGADIDAIGAISTRAAPGIPEPATWAMMILGFGAVGSVVRRRGALARA